MIAVGYKIESLETKKKGTDQNIAFYHQVCIIFTDEFIKYS